MKLFVVMPDVRECVVADCAFNEGRACHARAVTIGDGAHPAGDTYHPTLEHRATSRMRAGIGACKIDCCEWNEDTACRARSVRVAYHQGHADCVTFSPRDGPTWGRVGRAQPSTVAASTMPTTTERTGASASSRT